MSYKLYHYDHCPYCVKARMIFGLKGIDFQDEVLLNDDEKTPIEMIGQKMVPILIKENGDILPESLDIIKYIDSQNGETLIHWSESTQEMTQWLTDSRDYVYFLAMPRWVQADLEEFKTQGAKDYFTKKKEGFVGPFPAVLAETKKYVKLAHEALDKLSPLIQSPFVYGAEVHVDDFHVFANLRSLSIVKGLKFPEKVQQYMNHMSEASKVPLHSDIAI